MTILIAIGVLVLLTLHLVVLMLIKVTGMTKWKDRGDRVVLICLFLVPFFYDAIGIIAYYQLRSPA